MQEKIIKIAVVGPECSGKSVLSQALAKHYQTMWVPEYSRFYCEDLTRECTLQDELNMFYGQLALEKAVESIVPTNLLICDTTFLTVKVWSDHQFNETPQVVLDKLKTHQYDFYILLKNDLPWEDDPLRDFEHLGNHFMNVWRDELNALSANYKEVSGMEKRTENAIAAIDGFLAQRIKRS